MTLAGHLHLEAAKREDGRTILARQSFGAPFHLGKPYWDGRSLQVRVVNATAGILSGDRLDLDIRVGAGAALTVVTPAATRAFMMRGGAAQCRQRYAVEKGGWLEFAAEPLFPHKETHYAQSTRLELAEGAEAYYADALAPGRAARGETWAWRELRLGLDVAIGADPVLRERLAGPGGALARLAAFHGSREAWFGTVVAVSPRLNDDGLWEAVRSLDGKGCRLGASRLCRGGWIVRLVAPGSPGLREGLSELRALLSEKLPHLKGDLRKV